MFLASKIVCSGIVFLLMSPWISGPRQTPLDSGPNFSREPAADSGLASKDPRETADNDVKETQQTLQNKGHYGGKVDGVLGLRTRASIREFQKAEKLAVNGQLDVETAVKLGVKPEVREPISPDTTQDKPSAGIKLHRGSRRSSKTPQKPVQKSLTAPPA